MKKNSKKLEFLNSKDVLEMLNLVGIVKVSYFSQNSNYTVVVVFSLKDTYDLLYLTLLAKEVTSPPVFKGSV